MTMGVFLCTSCTDDATEQTLTEILDSQQQVLTLVSQTEDPIIIDDLTNTSPQVAKGRANDAGGNDRGRFNITLKFLVPPTERQEEVFNEAAGRWERIIIGDVPSFTGIIPSALLLMAHLMTLLLKLHLFQLMVLVEF